MPRVLYVQEFSFSLKRVGEPPTEKREGCWKTNFTLGPVEKS